MLWIDPSTLPSLEDKNDIEPACFQSVQALVPALVGGIFVAVATIDAEEE